MNMKNFIPLLIIFCFVSFASHLNAQVGIGTPSPHSSAILDLSGSTNKGFKLPEVNLSTPPATPAKGLMVWNTNGSYGSGEGIYYHDGSAWQKMTIGAGADNLGNHAATENIKLNGNWLSNDGGNKGIRILDNGNVGIGEDNPVYPLHITLPDNGALNGIRFTGNRSTSDGHATRLEFHAPGSPADANKKNFELIHVNPNIGFGQTSNSLNFRAVTDAGLNAANIMTMTHGGNVGIGTSAPSLLFTVSSSSGANLLAEHASNNSNSAGFLALKARGTIGVPAVPQANDNLLTLGAGGYNGSTMYNYNKAAILMAAAETWSATANGSYISFHTTPKLSTVRAERMRIDDAGNIGIGIPDPKSKLHILTSATSGLQNFITNDGSNFGGTMLKINAKNPGGSAWLLAVGTGNEIDNTGTFSSKFVVQGDGNVGIGVPAPGYNLDIQSLFTTRIRLRGAASGYTNAGIILEASDVAANYRGTGIFMFDLAGQNEWYAGRPYAASDRYQISRKASVATHNEATSSTSTLETTILLTLSNAGALTIASTYHTSDLAYKQNIKPITNPVDVLSKINGVIYDRNTKYYDVDPEKDPTMKNQPGLIAQEVEKILPNLVIKDEVTGLRAVNYTGLVPYLLEAVKEKQNQIEKLQRDNNELQTIKAELSELKSYIYSEAEK